MHEKTSYHLILIYQMNENRICAGCGFSATPGAYPVFRVFLSSCVVTDRMTELWQPFRRRNGCVLSPLAPV